MGMDLSTWPPPCWWAGALEAPSRARSVVCSLAYVARDTIVPYPAECTSEKETTAFDFVLPGHSNPFRLCFSMRSPYFPPTSKFRWLSARPHL